MQCAIRLFQQYTTVNCKKVTKIYFSTQETAISTFKTVSAIPCSAQFRLFRYYFTFQILRKYFFSKYFSWGLNRNSIPSFKSIRSHLTISAEPRTRPPEAISRGRPDVFGFGKTTSDWLETWYTFKFWDNLKGGVGASSSKNSFKICTLC